MYGDGLQTRDFVYVGDVVDAFMAAGDSDADGYCNVVHRRARPRCSSSPRRSGSSPRFEPERAGEVRRSCLDAGGGGRLLGWSARTPLKQGLDQTLAAAR